MPYVGNTYGSARVHAVSKRSVRRSDLGPGGPFGPKPNFFRSATLSNDEKISIKCLWVYASVQTSFKSVSKIIRMIKEQHLGVQCMYASVQTSFKSLSKIIRTVR